MLLCGILPEAWSVASCPMSSHCTPAPPLHNTETTCTTLFRNGQLMSLGQGQSTPVLSTDVV